MLGFTSYRQPPDYVPSGSVLVQVWGVGVDGFDAKLVGISVGGGPSNSVSPAKPSSVPEAPPRTRKGSLVRSVSLRSKKGSQRTGSYDGGSEGGGSVSEPQVGYIPGRSFVGRVLECGWEVKDEVVKRGEWVVGLLDIKKVSIISFEFLPSFRKVMLLIEVSTDVLDFSSSSDLSAELFKNSSLSTDIEYTEFPTRACHNHPY